MEPDDLSFIEISGEDDSLLPLQQISTNDVSSLNKIYFTCSPLQIPRSACSVNPPPLVSPIAGITGNKDVGKLELPSNRDGVDKGNMNSNKPEVPKLIMEPQQMKRKKKGRGYNLRKSLAWDKAFFTEEGVLDPLELSMISGNSGKSTGKMLSVIEEDGREYLGGSPEELTALGENMFSELPASNVSEDKKSSGALLPTIDSSAGLIVASTSMAKRKVISALDVNRRASKRSGCPQPVASASLKRPANTKSMKSTTKELKISKTPVRKPDTSMHSATAKVNIPGAGNAKGNKIAQPAIRVQRNVGLKGSSGSIKSTQSDAGSGLDGRSMAAKPSVQQARRNVTKSTLEIRSSTRYQHPVVSKTTSALKIDPYPPLPTPGPVSNNHDGGSCKVAISHPSDGSMEHAQLQSAKPSGLRMPSPSLGFFNQAKAPASHSLLMRSKPSRNALESNISNFRKLGTLNAIKERPAPALQKVPDKATASDMRIPSSIKGSSIPTNLNTNSREKIHEIQMLESNLPSKSDSIGILNYQQNLLSPCNDQQSLEHEGRSKNEKISHVVDNESKSTDSKLLLHRELSDKLRNDDNVGVANIYPMSMDLSGAVLENTHFSSHLQSTKDMTDNKCMEEKMSYSLFKNHAASSESQSGDAIYDSIKGTVQRRDGWLSSENIVNEQSSKEVKERKACTNQVSVQSQKPLINNGALFEESRPSELQNCKSAKTADACQEVGCCSGGIVENSICQPHSEVTVEAKECMAGIDKFCTKSQVEDAAFPSVEGILSAGRSEVVLSPSALDKMVVDDVNEKVIDGSELKISGALCSVPPPVQDCGFDMAETAECPHGDDTISVFTDAQLCHDIELYSQTNSAEPEMISKDQQINVVTAAIAEISSVHSSSGSFSGYDLQHLETQPRGLEQLENDGEVNGMIALTHVKNTYTIDDINVHKDVENKQYMLSVNNDCSNSDLQPADDIPLVHNDWLNNRHIDCQQYVEGNQILKAYEECLSENSTPPEDSGEFSSGKAADVCLDVKGCQRELETPQDLDQHEHIEERNEEVAGFDNTIEKSVVEDAQMQVLEGSLLVHSCKSSISTTVVDEVHEQSPVHPELLNSDLAAAQGSLDAHGLSLGDKLIVSNSSSEEYHEKNLCGNLMDAVLEQSDACENEPRSSVILIQIGTAVREGGIDKDPKADCASNNDDIQNIEVNVLKRDALSEEASNSLNNDISNHQIKHELENPIFTTEDATMSSSGGCFQDVEFNALKSDVLPVETSFPQRNGGSNCEMDLELTDTIYPTEGQNATVFLKSGNDKKEKNLLIKPPPHAVPFSDEWLAAFEAAGEEILTMKSGAVQNSPPDKSPPEPGPWSPVKRKNNQGIGPFDCTKFTNGNNNTPPLNSS